MLGISGGKGKDFRTKATRVKGSGINKVEATLGANRAKLRAQIKVIDLHPRDFNIKPKGKRRGNPPTLR